MSLSVSRATAASNYIKPFDPAIQTPKPIIDAIWRAYELGSIISTLRLLMARRQ